MGALRALGAGHHTYAERADIFHVVLLGLWHESVALPLPCLLDLRCQRSSFERRLRQTDRLSRRGFLGHGPLDCEQRSRNTALVDFSLLPTIMLVRLVADFLVFVALCRDR